MHLVLALLLQSTLATPEPALPSRDRLLAAYDETVLLISAIIKELPTRMGVTPDYPHLGFTMRTEELGIGADGLPKRHTFIVAVFRESSAFTEGIRPGDRITAIGDIPVDTLKPKAVLYYLSDHPETIPLVLERNGKTYKVLMRRAALPCAAALWRAFPVAVWRNRMTRLRTLVIATRTQMASAQLTDQQTVQAIADIQQTATLIRASIEVMSNQLDPAQSPRCTLVK